jgi:hypothetical protein
MDLANSMSGDTRAPDNGPPPSADRLCSMSAMGVVSKVDGIHGAGVVVVALRPMGVYGSLVKPAGVCDKLRPEFKLVCAVCTPEEAG